MTFSRVLFASYGNDSVALIQWTHEAGLRDVIVAYSDTGWQQDGWAARVDKGRAWAKSLGFQTIRLGSQGMVGLIQHKKAWPRGGGGKFQFCTKELKEWPALAWLDLNDPDKEAICMVGIRREESANRTTFPEWTESSPNHGGRSLHAPLVTYTERQRNELVARTPMLLLPTRSKECYPCVNAGKRELKLLDEVTILKIEDLEAMMGTNSKGNARVMFSPKRHNGAIGIRAVVEDAKHGHDDLWQSGCDGGWCEAA